MDERVRTPELARRLAKRMGTDQATAAAWLEGVVETLYACFKAEERVTITGFGSFYVRAEGLKWVFKFNPGQKLRALFGWSSSYSGRL
jgi:nucleoid DNA-binding protein